MFKDYEDQNHIFYLIFEINISKFPIHQLQKQYSELAKKKKKKVYHVTTYLLVCLHGFK